MFSYLRRGPGFYRRVGGLAVPIILQNLITSTLAMADTFMVGMLGEVPMAAVTLANIPLFLMGWRFLGGNVLISSLYAMAATSILVDVFASLFSFSRPLISLFQYDPGHTASAV